MAVDNKLKLGDLDDYDYGFLEPAPEGTGFHIKAWYQIKNSVEKFLYFAAGVDTQLLRYCPHSDRVKEQCIGGTVLATAVLAFFSSFYAFYIVFSPKVALAIETTKAPTHVGTALLAILFGLLWATMIFNLDRFIVSSTGQGNGKENITWGEVWAAAPRILMAFLIAIVLSKPLEIKIMQSEIDAELLNIQRNWIAEQGASDNLRFDAEQKAIEVRKGELLKERDLRKAEIATADELVIQQQKALQDEIDGTGGSKQKDFGPAARNKKERLESLKQISEAKHASLDPEIKSLDVQLTVEQSKINEITERRKNNLAKLTEQAASQNGLMKRIEVAGKQFPIAGLMLLILMAFLEIAPILFKMMIRLSPYDYMKENIKQKTLATKGIDLNENLGSPKDSNEVHSPADGKDKNIELKDATYYEAEVLKENQVGKLEIEIALTKVAQQKFLERVREDIKNNPSKYIRQNTLVEGSAAAGVKSFEVADWKGIRNSVTECAESLKTENAGKSYNYGISDCMKSIVAMKAISGKNKSA